jgi:hypothetical protein
MARKMQQTAPAPRRQFERRPVRANAIVHCRGKFQCATVIDYSEGGLRLEGTFGLIKTDPIQIEFISGARVPARVAWSLGSQTGVIFVEPLQAGHPALIELVRRADNHLRRRPLLAAADRQLTSAPSAPDLT